MRRLFVFLLPLLFLANACYISDNYFPDVFPGENGAVSNLKDPEIAWSVSSFEATLGASNVFPTLSNSNKVSISYSSSDAAVASIGTAGDITLKKPGVTEITAASAENDSYYSASVSYLLLVLDPNSAGTDDIPLSFDSTGDPSSDDDISNTKFKGKISIVFSDSGDATVSGDSYGYVSVDGNKVTVNNTGSEVLLYVLSGSTSNGYFKVYGSKKQGIVLNGVSISNPDGAAINNQNKKRTFVVLKGTNTISDGASAAYEKVGDEDLKGVFFSEAQLIFSGDGYLSVNALNSQGKAGIVSDDYIRLMASPTVKVTAGKNAGNGVKGKDYVQLSGGALVVSVSADMKKAVTTDDYVLVEGGTHMLTVSGGVAYDDEDAEYSGSAGIKADNYFAMTGGSLTINNTGSGGKGINAGSYDFDETDHKLADSYISGGTLKITTSGNEVHEVSAKGMKIGYKVQSERDFVYGGNLTVSGGTIVINCTHCEGLEAKGDLTFEGGETYVSSNGDDAVNCQGELVVNDGFIYAYSSQNDAMDSNGNTKLNGGYVYAVSTKGDPEVALDANTEEGYKLYINDGVTLVAYGGLERGYEAAQTVYTFSAAAGAWNALHDGKNYIAAFKAPAIISSFIVSAPNLSAGYPEVSVGGETRCNNVWATGGISGGSQVSLSAYTGNIGGPGGPGGFGRR